MRAHLVSVAVGAALVAGLGIGPTWAQPSEDETATESAEEAKAEAEAPEVPQNIRLRRLQNKVSSLKTRAWEINARAKELTARLLNDGVAARATIAHRNRMGKRFRLVKLVCSLDGTQLFAGSKDAGTLPDSRSFDLYDGLLAPGSHTLSVHAVYRGNSFKVAKYFEKYRFTVRSSHTFTVGSGKTTRVEIVAKERGITSPTAKKPKVDFVVVAGD